MNGGPALAAPPDFTTLHGERIFLRGFRSGLSWGSAFIKTDLLNGTVRQIATVEYCVTAPGSGTVFAAPGDSGSLVYHPATGVVRGMLFAGTFDGVGYFTRIDYLFDDIKAKARVADIRLYVEYSPE
ncbi:hypothetical protein N7478_008158 [Penicillium angulare]|uniref:uncharacterized protein n=1 Tax=Penicillium angulare TaxID=116970 RepID=UPI00253FDFC9|nr:uncharacterized protein N7478_008158 [Penicillium angulare]KAJ5273033.1 hypothetical protein N7478_008158 [Penicillium angulare]